jgi:hypothetical protein
VRNLLQALMEFMKMGVAVVLAYLELLNLVLKRDAA